MINPRNRPRRPDRPGLIGPEPLEGRQLLNATPSSREAPGEGPSRKHASHVAPPAHVGGSTHQASLAEARAGAAIAHRSGASASARVHSSKSHRLGANLAPKDVAGFFGNGSAPTTGPGNKVAFAPSQVASAYGFDQLANQGQGVTVAIVDAFDNPNVASDLAAFNRTFGLPQMDGLNGDPTFTKLTPQGQPAGNTGWGLEIALDVEWVHAMAPKANIVLVESINNYDDNGDGTGLYPAAQYAASLPGVVVVSNSYGSTEYSSETLNDHYLTTPSGHSPVAFTASTGDNGAPGLYPAVSPNVVAIGGTSLYTISTKGRYGLELGWSGSGGGVSTFESKPSYQSSLPYSNRATPDISFVADPSTGVYVYDTYEPGGGGYYQVGGTSLSSPIAAAMIALGDQGRLAKGLQPLSTAAIDSAIYGAYGSPNYLSNFHDVTSGSNGNSAGAGYDLVTGVGSPKVPQFVQLLSNA